MNFENLLFRLHQHRESIAKDLDEALCKELIHHIKTAFHSKQISQEFFLFCGKNLSQFVNSNKHFPGDELSESEVETYVNEIIEAIEPNDSEKSDENKDQ